MNKYFLLASLLSISQYVFADIKDNQDIISYTKDKKNEQISLLKELVDINSGTENKQGVIAVGEKVKPLLENLGFKVEWKELPEGMKHAGSLIATKTNNSSSKEKFLVIAHLDTVFPSDSSFQKFEYIDDKKKFAKGPGVIDDKGGIVTIIYALKALDHINELKNKNITIVLVGDEELAAKPTDISRKSLIDAAKDNSIALGFEFALNDNQLITNRRGLSEWYINSSGKQSHSSRIFEKDVGYGAIFAIANTLNEIQKKLSHTNGLTINPGILLGGSHPIEDIEQGSGKVDGKKTIVSNNALAHGDIRYLNENQRDYAKKIMTKITLNNLPLTETTISFKDIIPTMSETSANRDLLESFNQINKNLTHKSLSAVPSNDRGGADISYISKYMEGAIDGLGPWGTGAHTEKETIDLDSLETVTNRTAIFLKNYPNF
ncbi:M20/M25/M40 family metallo-hydrolase [Acinetobacter pollinis]|uniref:M20/M25/M40 family metallo-hydrolase n=1 Tax=Acinetobacter pollinis TaxID=2605270 RepID=UPI0018A31CA4|nr:M20/M25/M40 family metallo-hydrolase [Acinetobacter pollinis]MBF7690877.1 M20/M25/M40 family metallo-hydrolase [Acinetobacter pollinis]MBF7697355.1 M20/M25/M40 family metallo-hydrolase [Acinetobacter pollinis]